MREGLFNKSLLRTDEGAVLGVNLGADHCAEHEWGISTLQRNFGIPQGVVCGVEGRQVTQGFERLAFVSGKRTRTIQRARQKSKHTVYYAMLLTLNGLDAETALKRGIEGLYLGDWTIKTIEKEGVSIDSAWDDRGFRVALQGMDKESCAPLQALYDAFKQNDVCISIGGSLNPFDRGGLCLTIASQIPQTTRESVKAQDEDHIALLAAAAATGVEAALKAADRRYFALSPRWADESRTSVKFWLNPYDQQRNNHGWYTPEDLMLWTKGEGPVPKAAAAS